MAVPDGEASCLNIRESKQQQQQPSRIPLSRNKIFIDAINGLLVLLYGLFFFPNAKKLLVAVNGCFYPLPLRGLATHCLLTKLRHTYGRIIVLRF
ncbi:hypothetical protein A2U01_0006973 [Trifolium medium]|uniref:Uncharacterized protein n=1 Tax=Trifolium medium TaxID=97028 RepID=A0A392MGE5_9FABA|nr:hypothetical protein [Trifolium medium]